MGAPAGINTSWLIKFIRDSLTQNPLPAAALKNTPPASPDDYTYEDYVPVLSASAGGTPGIGNGTVWGRYIQVGKKVHTYGSLTLGSSTNFGTGSLYVSLPLPVAVRAIGGVSGSCYTSAGTSLAGIVSPQTSSSIGFLVPNSAGPSLNWVSGSTPWPATWSTGASVIWDFAYETT